MAYHVSWRHQGSESVCAKEKIPQEKEETTGSSQKNADYNARMPQGFVIKSGGPVMMNEEQSLSHQAKKENIRVKN